MSRTALSKDSFSRIVLSRPRRCAPPAELDDLS